MSDRMSNEEIFISKSFLMRAAKHRVEALDDGKFASGVNMALELLENIIENAPAAYVAPVVHGHWVYNRNGMDWNLGAWECSACKCKNNNLPGSEIYSPYSFVGSRYCPNCGAKMDKEEEND